MTTIAGNGTAGFRDGDTTTSQLNNPRGIAVDSLGNVYVSDTFNHRIRKISPLGQITTLAGSGIFTLNNGRGIQASFNTPLSIALDSVGNIYVADSWNHAIRKVTPDGDVSTVAGTSQGFTDGALSRAQFSFPTDVTVDHIGNLYIVDRLNNCIRKIIFAQNVPSQIFSFNQRISLFNTNNDANVHVFARDMNGNSIVGVSTFDELVQLRELTGSSIGEIRRVAFSNQMGIVMCKVTPSNSIEWAIQIDSTGDDAVNDVAFDEMGSIYSVGTFSRNVTFHTKFQNIEITVPMIGSTQNGFVAKHTRNGTLLWIAAVQGSPLHLMVKVFGDSAIVTIKFAKQIGSEQFSCIIVPPLGPTLSLSAVSYGMAVVRFSSDGRIVWSRLFNFAPWEQNHMLSISKSGMLSITGWCSLICSLYEMNDTTPRNIFSSPGNIYNGVNVLLDSNGTVASWSVVSRYIRITRSERFSCGLRITNTTAHLLSYGNQVPIRIDNATTLNLVIVNDVAFISFDRRQRLVLKLDEYTETLFNFDPTSIEWITCGRFDPVLGPRNTRGDIRKGTFALDMDLQLGYISEFPLEPGLSNNTLIRFRQVGRFNFRCGLNNGTHAQFFTFRFGEVNIIVSNVTSDGSYWGDIVRQTTISVSDTSSSMFAFTLTSTNVSLYPNGNRLLEMDFMNVSKFLLTTMDSGGVFEWMGIMALPKPLDPWLVYTEPVEVESSMVLNSTSPALIKTTEMRTEPTQTDETDKRPVWTLFGLSGPILYIFIGAVGFVVMLVMIGIFTVVFVKMRRKRIEKRNYEQASTVTYSTTVAGASNYQGTENRTLINPDTMFNLKEQIQRQK